MVWMHAAEEIRGLLLAASGLDDIVSAEVERTGVLGLRVLEFRGIDALAILMASSVVT